MDDIKDKIQDLVSGRLSNIESKEVLNAVENDSALKEYYHLMLLTEQAIDEEISSDHREYLKGYSSVEIKKVKGHSHIILWMGLAASILILVISVVTANLSLSDANLADQFTYNTIAIRSADSEEDILFNQAQKAYRDGNYEEVWAKLNEIRLEGSLLEKDKEWLEAITYLKTEGSKSSNFNNALNKIFEDSEHPYQDDAIKLKSELHSFWRFFVVKK